MIRIRLIIGKLFLASCQPDCTQDSGFIALFGKIDADICELRRQQGLDFVDQFLHG
jgi:hypothetical protein